MNLVAHQFLSFDVKELQIGNLLGETVRGKNYKNYPKLISLGILLHRNIDTFTDSHSIVKNSTKLFQFSYRKFAPIITDVVYDYFLIKNWNLFSDISFSDFIKHCYELFQKDNLFFDDKLKIMIKYLIKDDWFTRYGSYEGIETTLSQLSKRTKFDIEMNNSLKEFYLQENKLEEQFLEFFPEMITFCKKYIIKQAPELYSSIVKESEVL